MPTYEYVCDACEHEWEQMQSITAGHIKKCPECGKSRARRLISAGGALIFKGSGFYETDYRSESYKKGAKAAAKAKESASSDKKDSKKSATKKTSESRAD